MNRSFGLVTAVMFIVICMTCSDIWADNITGVSEANARELVNLIKPGDILIWNCTTCKGVQVMRVNSVRVSRNGAQPEFALIIERDILIESLHTYEMLSDMPCAQPSDPDQYEEYEPEGEWTIDLTYTYFLDNKSGSWITFESVIGIKNNPVTVINICREAMKNIRKCVAKLEKGKKIY